ncbi:MAG: hypothetical protein JW881_12410 [Spirochaetales bacterium]|nr:hypothetical protein [Spirochaetales bacterium]
MEQFYFLSIFFNLLGGIILSAAYIKEKVPLFSPFLDVIAKKEVKFIAGIASLIIGVFKLIVPWGIIIIGDLLPAATSFLVGAALVTDFFKESTTLTSETVKKMDVLVNQYRNIIGGTGMVMAVVHWLFGGAPVLL